MARRLTRQQILNTVAEHFFKQGIRGYDSNLGQCRYRGDNNTRCAIGCLMTDEEYTAAGGGRLEGLNIIDVAELQPRPVFKNFSVHDTTFLEELQLLHDNADNWLTTRHMQSALSIFAFSWDLSTTKFSTLSFSDR